MMQQLRVLNGFILKTPTPPLLTGAKLYANNATFTSKDINWRGLEFWGSTNLDQAAKVFFQNSIITNAYIGIATFHFVGKFDEDPTWYSPTNQAGRSPLTKQMLLRGGEIQVENCKFKNNNISIEIVGAIRKEPLSTLPTNGISFIKSTIFELNDLPYRIGDVELWPQLKIMDYKGLSILGCNFKNNYQGFRSNRLMGIESINSDTRISSADAILGYWNNFQISGTQQTIVDGFEKGIFSTNVGGIGSRLKVENTDLRNNTLSGIEIDLSFYPFIVNNYLNNSGELGAIITNGSSDFVVSQNKITSDIPAPGIMVINSGEDYNKIYNNEIDNGNPALVANGKNRSSFIDGSGLKFICNKVNLDTNDTLLDLYVFGNNGKDIDGISYFQGDALFALPLPPANNAPPEKWAAGNRFNLNKPFTQQPLNIFNENSSVSNFTYLYGDVSTNEKPIQYNIPLIHADFNNTCPYLYNSQDVIYRKNFKSAIFDLSNIANILRSKLNDSIISINDSIRIDSLFTLQRNYVNSLIRGYLYGGETVYLDSILHVFETNLVGEDYKIQMARLYLTQNKFSDAQALLTELIDSNGLSEPKKQDLLNMSNLYRVIEFLLNHDDQWDQVPSNMKDWVYSVLNENKGFYGLPLAKYIQYRYNIDDESEFSLPSPSGNLPTAINAVYEPFEVINDLDSIKISPNPLKDNLRITWTTNQKGSIGVLVIYDLSGKCLLKKQLYPGTSNISTSILPSGTCICTVFFKNKRFFQTKLIKD